MADDTTNGTSTDGTNVAAQFGQDMASAVKAVGTIPSPVNGVPIGSSLSEIGLGLMESHPKLKPDNFSDLTPDQQTEYAANLAKVRLPGVIKTDSGKLLDLTQHASEVPKLSQAQIDKMSDADKEAFTNTHGALFAEEDINSEDGHPAPFSGAGRVTVDGAQYEQLPSGDWSGLR
jgi:hypothetical protein